MLEVGEYRVFDCMMDDGTVHVVPPFGKHHDFDDVLVPPGEVYSIPADRRPQRSSLTGDRRMKSIAEDKQMPVDPNNVTSGRSPAYDESSNWPADKNNVTNDTAVHSGESDNRPAKPTI